MDTTDHGDDKTLHLVWLIYRGAVAAHIATDKESAKSEDEYRERAEKAGLAAVINLVGKAYQL